MKKNTVHDLMMQSKLLPAWEIAAANMLSMYGREQDFYDYQMYFYTVGMQIMKYIIQQVLLEQYKQARKNLMNVGPFVRIGTTSSVVPSEEDYKEFHKNWKECKRLEKALKAYGIIC